MLLTFLGVVSMIHKFLKDFQSPTIYRRAKSMTTPSVPGYATCAASKAGSKNGWITTASSGKRRRLSLARLTKSRVDIRRI